MLTAVLFQVSDNCTRGWMGSEMARKIQQTVEAADNNRLCTGTALELLQSKATCMLPHQTIS